MKTVLVVLLILISSTVFAQSEPLEFKGFTLGSDISLVRNNPKFQCKDTPGDTQADQKCNLKFLEVMKKTETIAGIPMDSLTLYYYNEKLHQILILFNSKSFSQVVEALQGKYGKTSPLTETIQNKMGATFENQQFIWIRRDSKDIQTITAERYTSTLDTSSLFFNSESGTKEFKKRNKAKSKELEKDL